MVYRQRIPAPPLDAFVEWIWVCENEPQPHGLERILPTGAAQLIVNLKEDETRLYAPEPPYRCLTTAGTVLSGIRSSYQIIDTSEQEHVAGVVFRAGGTAAFTRVPAHETTGTDVAFEDLWGRRSTALLREQLLEGSNMDAMLDALEATLASMLLPRDLHPAVAFALRTFDRAPHTACIGSVTGAIGMSPKRFIDRFKAAVGVTPKRYCRIRRFQRAVALAHRGAGVDWAQVALDCGYFDQAHFIHDFRSFSGLTPGAYEAGRTPFQNHVKFLQSDAAGI
jgi:AraC-like DNA-binding protein